MLSCLFTCRTIAGEVFVLTPIPLSVKGILKHTEDTDMPRFQVYPGKVDICFAGWNSLSSSDITISYGHALTSYRHNGLQFEVWKNGAIFRKACDLPGLKESSSMPLPLFLFSDILEPADRIEIKFFPKSKNTIIFLVEMEADAFSPVLEQWGEGGYIGLIPFRFDYWFEKSYQQQISLTLKKYDQPIVLHPSAYLHLKLKKVLIDDSAGYAYQLLKQSDSVYQDNWTKAENRYFSIPMDLAAGRYKLLVRHTGLDAFTAIPIVIVPKWYATTGFRISFILLSFLLFTAITFKYYRRKLKISLRYHADLSTRMLAMQAYITPHMMRNALTALQDLLIQGKLRHAQRFADALCRLLQRAYKGHRQLYHTLADEWKMLHAYIEVQQWRQRFEVTIQMPDNAGWEKWQLPAGLLQPVIENAIKYNLAGNANESLVVTAIVQQDDVFLTIMAIGNPQSSDLVNAVSNTGSGFGLEWLDERLSLHNRMYPEAIITLAKEFSQHQSSVTFYCKNMRIWTY